MAELAGQLVNMVKQTNTSLPNLEAQYIVVTLQSQVSGGSFPDITTTPWPRPHLLPPSNLMVFLGERALGNLPLGSR